jgi:hypothetical protein
VLAQLSEVAERLLKRQLDPIPRYRLLRDVLEYPVDDPILKKAQQNMLLSKQAIALAEAQFPDGTWGRFHSQDSKVKSPFRTTEFAIRRGLSLGLTKKDLVLAKAVIFMEKFLNGKANWTDCAEKHEGWVPNTRFITAGTLSEVDPFHPLLDPIRVIWEKILFRTFHDGDFDPLAEREAQGEINGIVTKGKYLHLGMMYPLLILSSGHNSLAEDLELSLLRWLWDRENGIYYITPARISDFPSLDSSRFSSWLDSLLLLSRFHRSGRIIASAFAWIWEQRDAKGFWDFHPPVSGSPFFPLSENWRRSENRVIDCSVKVLLLLKKMALNLQRLEVEGSIHV